MVYKVYIHIKYQYYVLGEWVAQLLTRLRPYVLKIVEMPSLSQVVRSVTIDFESLNMLTYIDKAHRFIIIDS